MVGVTWDVETEEGVYSKLLDKTLKPMIYSNLWVSDMEILNVWYVMIPIFRIRNKKIRSFF